MLWGVIKGLGFWNSSFGGRIIATQYVNVYSLPYCLASVCCSYLCFSFGHGFSGQAPKSQMVTKLRAASESCHKKALAGL